MCMFNKAYVAQKEYLYRSQSKDKSKKQQCEITEQQRKMTAFRAKTRQERKSGKHIRKSSEREMSTYFRESAKTDETLTMYVHRQIH